MLEVAVVFIGSFVFSIIAIQLYRGSSSVADMLKVFGPKVIEQRSSTPAGSKLNAARSKSSAKPKLVRGGIKTPWGW